VLRSRVAVLLAFHHPSPLCTCACVRVQRSWHFYDSAVIALATNATDPTTADIWSTVVQRWLYGNVTVGWWNGTTQVLADGDYVFATTDVAWVWADGNGYVPQIASAAVSATMPQQVFLSGKTRNGSWTSIGPYMGTVTGRVLQLSLLHGRQVNGAGYAYALVPNITVADMAAWSWTSQGVTHVVALQDAHAVANATSRTVTATFWAPTTVTLDGCIGPFTITVAASAPCHVVVVDEGSGAGNGVTVWASNPDTPGLSLNVTVDRTLSGGGCTPAAPGSTAFAFALPADPSFMGQAQALRCAY